MDCTNDLDSDNEVADFLGDFEEDLIFLVNFNFSINSFPKVSAKKIAIVVKRTVFSVFYDVQLQPPEMLIA